MQTVSRTERLQGYVKVARAPFLALPLTLILLGSAVAAYAGAFDLIAAVLALVGLVSLHVSVNSRNEYRDYHSGVDYKTEPTPFSGGSKTLPEEELEPEAAKRLALVTAGIGALIGSYFLVTIGLVMLPIFVIGAVSVLFYTSHLARYGLGELFAGLGLGGLPVLGAALVQMGQITVPMLLASVPATLLTFNLLLLNEFPDEEADKVGGRQNLIHRLGRRKAAWIYALAGAGVPVSIVVACLLGPLPVWALLGVVPSVLLATPVKWATTRPSESVPLPALRHNVLWILGTNTFLGIGLLVPILL